MNKLFILLLPLILTSCASTMPGIETNTGSKNISATIEKNEVFSNEMIQMFQYSIKNNTGNWIELEGATLGANTDVNVLVGERITSWIEACELEKKVSDYNTAMVLGAIAVTGAVVAGSSQHQQTSNTGAVIALGSITAMGVRDFQNSKNKVDFQKAFPKRHIFQPFSLPPFKVIQRWIIVENPTGKPFELKIKSVSGEQVSISTMGSYITPALVR